MQFLYQQRGSGIKKRKVLENAKNLRFKSTLSIGNQ